jgi:hypothetical protein
LHHVCKFRESQFSVFVLVESPKDKGDVFFSKGVLVGILKESLSEFFGREMALPVGVKEAEAVYDCEVILSSQVTFSLLQLPF